MWKRRKKRQIKLPRGHKYSYILESTDKTTFTDTVAIQKGIKDDKSRYIGLDDCYNLYLAYGNDIKTILGSIR